MSSAYHLLTGKWTISILNISIQSTGSGSSTLEWNRTAYNQTALVINSYNTERGRDVQKRVYS